MIGYPDANSRERVYADYDEEFETWAVFGELTGHCYSQCNSEYEAEAVAAERNRRKKANDVAFDRARRSG